MEGEGKERRDGVMGVMMRNDVSLCVYLVYFLIF